MVVKVPPFRDNPRPYCGLVDSANRGVTTSDKCIGSAGEGKLQEAVWCLIPFLSTNTVGPRDKKVQDFGREERIQEGILRKREASISHCKKNKNTKASRVSGGAEGPTDPTALRSASRKRSEK